MTDNLLQKLEEKVMTLVTELEELRKETHRVKQENTTLKAEKVNYSEKLHSLISLLEAVDVAHEPTVVHNAGFAQVGVGS